MRRTLIPVVPLVLLLATEPEARASGAPSNEDVARLGAVLLVVPQLPALGSTFYYMGTGPRPSHWVWSAYNLLAGGVALWAGWMYARFDFWGYAAPCFAAGAIEVGYAAWSLAASVEGEPARLRLGLAPGGLALSLSF